jgi:CubicO group peptidase (beta-lactamase class C family)
MQSVTKSVTSLLFGTLFDRGLLNDLTDEVWRYLPRRAGHRWIDERYPITIHQVLAMSAGLDWNEQIPYTDPRNDAVRMNAAEDWVGYVLDREMRPGWPADRLEYQSGLSMLLGELIRRVTGKRVDEYAVEKLFGPMGIDRFVWGSTEDGTVQTGGGLFLRPRDLAKLGQLVLNRGTWNGQRILSEEWIDISTAKSSGNQLSDYGYQWWLPRELGVRAVMARGYGSQTLSVLPELNTVIVAACHDWHGGGQFPSLYVDHLLPLLK